MPYDDPDADDPHMLVGVGLPADETATREMAAAFADEFAQMGFDRERLLHLFTSPFYSGAHAARELLGDAEVTRIVVESLRVYARQQRGVVDTAEDGEESSPDHSRGHV
jgi:hypothetical protein